MISGCMEQVKDSADETESGIKVDSGSEVSTCALAYPMLISKKDTRMINLFIVWVFVVKSELWVSGLSDYG